MNPEALYMRIRCLIECMPDLANITLTPEIHKWLGDAYALVNASGEMMALVELKNAIDTLSLHAGYGGASVSQRTISARGIPTILYRVLAIAELKAPTAIQGNFIPAGNAFDAMAAVSKILNEASNDILIVDPYLDEKVLTDLAIAAPENVTIRLLADAASHKPSLDPAFRRWVSQYGIKRPLELKLAMARSIHDRLIIIDNSSVWVLTQSLNAFAARSPATIVRFPDPTIKIAAYQDMWQGATLVSL